MHANFVLAIVINVKIFRIFDSEMIPLSNVYIIIISNMLLLKSLYYAVIISNTLYYLF